MNKNFIYPPYFVIKRRNRKYLIITEYGSYVILDKDEFKKFQIPDKKLFEKLEKKEIIITEKNLGKVQKKYMKRFLLSETNKVHSIVIKNGEKINKDIIDKILEFVVSFKGENRIKIIGASEKLKSIIKEKVKNNIFFSEEVKKCNNNICKGIISFLAYDIEGNIYPCEIATQFEIFKIGNIFSLPEFDKKAVKSFLSFSIFNPLCIFCPFQAFCTSCPVEIFKKYGRLGIVDRERCKRIMKEKLEQFFCD